jgi:hypothetical protein
LARVKRILLLSPEILLTKPCLFFPANAALASSQETVGFDKGALRGFRGLDGMFEEGQSGLRKDRVLADCYTTDPEAEVLAFDIIEPKLVQAVRLLRPDDELSARIIAFAPTLDMKVSQGFFTPRDDWRFWGERAKDTTPSFDVTG